MTTSTFPDIPLAFATPISSTIRDKDGNPLPQATVGVPPTSDCENTRPRRTAVEVTPIESSERTQATERKAVFSFVLFVLVVMGAGAVAGVLSKGSDDDYSYYSDDYVYQTSAPSVDDNGFFGSVPAQVWNDNVVGYYFYWSSYLSPTCIDHPEAVATLYTISLQDSYSFLAESMLNAFRDARLTSEVADAILFSAEPSLFVQENNHTCLALDDYYLLLFENQTDLVPTLLWEDLVIARAQWKQEVALFSP